MATFDLGDLLRKNDRKYADKLALHASKVCGVKKRMEESMKMRRSSRLTTFDSIRDLSPCEKPAPTKVDILKKRLAKYKIEKEMKKKEEAAKKRKPFLLGTAVRATLSYMPPPPPCACPSTSGRVTRSQAAKNTAKTAATQQLKKTQSFAPENAQFRPPKLKSGGKLPTLAPLSQTRHKTTVTFNPVLPPKKPEIKPKSNRNKPPVKESGKRSTNLAKKVEEPNKKSINPAKKVEEPNKKSINPAKKVEEPNKKSINPAKNSTKTTTSQESNLSSDKELSEKSAALTKNTTKTTFLNEAKNDLLATPKNLIPNSESGSEEKLRSPRTPEHLPLTPEQIEDAKRSPYVTISRGKNNARNEMKWRYSEGLIMDEDASEPDSVSHFRLQLNSEIARLTDTCDSWENVLEQMEFPEHAQDAIRTAVGQARLLMSKKMQQFAELIEQCAHQPPGCPLVTPEDLEGFWDMVYMQVVNVDQRFKKLEESRKRGWEEEQPAQAERRARARPAGRKAAKSAATSSLRDIIAASRKAKKEQRDVPPSPVSVVLAEAPNEKTFEAGFFCVRSPVRSPAPRTPDTAVKRSLLKAVLSSEANKASTSKMFAMLRASSMGKDAELGIAGITPLPQTPMSSVEMSATPVRSILKSTTKASGIQSAKKTPKQVVFNDSEIESSNTSHTSDMETALDTTYDITETETTKTDIEFDNSMVLEKIADNKTPILTRQHAVDVNDDLTPSIVKTKNRGRNTAKILSENVDPNTEQSSRRYSLRSSRSSKLKESVAKNLANSLAIAEVTPPKKTPKSSAKKKQIRTKQSKKYEQDMQNEENNEQITTIEQEVDQSTKENDNEERNKKTHNKTPKQTPNPDMTSEANDGDYQNDKTKTRKTPRRSAKNIGNLNKEQDVITENNDHIDGLTPRRTSKRSIENKLQALHEVSLNVVGETVQKRASRSRRSTAASTINE